jgi:signal transduction histidine kinase
MVTFVALIISIFLQFIAAIIAISLTKVTKYNLSWILISIALIFLAIRRLVEIIPFLNNRFSEDLRLIDHWIGIVTSILIAVGIFLIKKIFNKLKEAEQIRKSSERRILNAIIRTEERERQRFAKDLHDGLGPTMSTIKMSLSALSKGNLDEFGKAVVDNLEEVIDQGIREIKEISNNLSPHILNNFGLASAISTFINKINYNDVIRIKFTTNLEKERFSENVESVLYRAVCELINNTIKHAEAKTIDIKLNHINDLLIMSYKDDGKGFLYDEQSQFDPKGMGYYNIRSRLNTINGQIDIETAQGKGLSADIHVKLK